MKRVAAIGLDAAEWWVVEKLLEEGRMPNMARLRERGTECRLETGSAYRSELPWTQFLTGVEATTTGYWSTADFDPSEYSAFLVGAYTGQPFFARDDLSVICFDVPHTTIHPDVNGVQVTAWGAHSSQYPRASRPMGTLDEIDARFGVHPAFDNDYDGTWNQPKYVEAISSAMLEGARRRIDAAEWTMQENPDWELFLTVLSESHSAGHLLWHGIDPRHPLHHDASAADAREKLIAVYEALDEGVGRIVAAAGPDASVIVFAAHGMQPNANDLPSLVLLPELLHRARFGEPLLIDLDQEAWADAGYPPVRPPARLQWRQVVQKQFALTAEERAQKQRRMNLPDWPVDYLRRLQHRVTGKPRMTWQLNTEFPPECTDSLDDMAAVTKGVQWQPPAYYSSYWPEMDWFVLPTFSDAHVRLNVAGREGSGRIAADEFGAACDRFEQFVRRCTNPRTGRPAVGEIHRMRTHPLQENGPDGDLVVEWTEPLDALEHPDVGMVGPLPYLRTGEHSANGFAFMAGPGIERSDLGTRSAFDLAPTVLSMLGKPPDRELRGTPLVSVER